MFSARLSCRVLNDSEWPAAGLWQVMHSPRLGMRYVCTRGFPFSMTLMSNVSPASATSVASVCCAFQR
jgi:hypothetical protein